ncbi:heme binding zinc finger protein [Scheffersomyces coipomensis]|uniref:heme binding zinc finger protein n=1 Tax=Scheffersomyces coipomensis TaxID=1788519 RepID=UPI00315CAE69
MNLVFYLFLYIIIIASIISIIIIFADLPTFRNTPLQKLKTFLTKLLNHGQQSFNYVNYTVFDNKLQSYANWIVPIGYLFVVTLCVSLFFINTYPTLTTLYSSKSSALTLINLYIDSTIALVYIATTLAIFVTPGPINSKTYKTFKNNQLIFFDNRTCSTCLILKPARSKHCNTCGKCYPLYDHHCIWLNNCVGQNNFKWFILFLLSNINLLIGGTILTFKVLQYQFIRWGKKSYWSLIKSSNDANKITGIFFIICIIFSLITISFTLLHVRYIYLGVTTNELDKWQDVEYLVKLGTLYKSSTPLVDNQIYIEKIFDHNTNQHVYISLTDDRILIKEDNISSYHLTQIKSVANDLINIYDNGFWNNLQERLAF